MKSLYTVFTLVYIHKQVHSLEAYTPIQFQNMAHPKVSFSAVPFTVLNGQLYLADATIRLDDFYQPYYVFNADDELMYTPFCDDFGPMNLDQIFRFHDKLETKRSLYPAHKLIFSIDPQVRNTTNAVFLLGTYLILAHKMKPEEVCGVFDPLMPHLEMYRDATFSESRFRLTLLDCWQGLVQARALGWLDQIDLDEYAHYDNPLEGDLHCIVPGKLIAFKGPRALPDGQLFHDQCGYRTFAPRFYAEAAFADMAVSTVVRLNEPEYDPADFASAGIACVGLEFDDCTPPPPHIVAAFLFAVSQAPGAVAVHCKAGLGRTGTLIALYMMAHHGFTARAAMGWLRIVRPGSVIGDQQAFLCSVEAAGGDIISAAAAAAAAEDFGDDADRADRCCAASQLAEDVAGALRSPLRTSARAARAIASAAS